MWPKSSSICIFRQCSLAVIGILSVLIVNERKWWIENIFYYFLKSNCTILEYQIQENVSPHKYFAKEDYLLPSYLQCRKDFSLLIFSRAFNHLWSMTFQSFRRADLNIVLFKMKLVLKRLCKYPPLVFVYLIWIDIAVESKCAFENTFCLISSKVANFFFLIFFVRRKNVKIKNYFLHVIFL